MKNNLPEAVALYLATRRSLGFALVKDGIELQGLVRYSEKIGHAGPLTVSLALQWAQLSQTADRRYWAARLDIVRRFARFWIAYDPQTQIPPRGVFGPTYRRRAVHVYTPQELDGLLAATATLASVHPWRAQTLTTLVGLLACTGLRIGEALGLSDSDIDWATGVLTIRHAKGGHARLVPVQSSTLAALARYQTLRDQTMGPGGVSTFFVSVGGQPLGYKRVSALFRRVCRRLGWTQKPIPRLHDLRHSFAVRTLLAWYRTGEPIEPKLWSLSTYLGHRHATDTYWYLSAVPELMQVCQQRFAAAQTWASGGIAHE
jgi:integrase